MFKSDRNTQYEHEDEYRLIFINSIEDEKQYFDVSTRNGICDGIFIETVPILFRDDEDIVYFGPKVSELTINKYKDAFKLSGLPHKGSLDKLLQPSRKHYR